MKFLNVIHPEALIDGFTKLDGTVTFYSFVKAAMLQLDAKNILDFGAGRGAFWESNTKKHGSLWRRHLQDLRFNDAHVIACDIDPVVKNHPCSHEQIIIQKDLKLPFEDEKFDLIVSDVTFEHIEHPEIVSRELQRVLRKGGYICVRTPNATGYVKIFTQLTPNKLHSKFLKYIQPNRREEDIFPTAYKMNTVSSIKKLFPNCAIYFYRDYAEPAYFFGSEVIYRILLFFHKVLPDYFGTSLCVFIKK